MGDRWTMGGNGATTGVKPTVVAGVTVDRIAWAVDITSDDRD